MGDVKMDWTGLKHQRLLQSNKEDILIDEMMDQVFEVRSSGLSVLHEELEMAKSSSEYLMPG